MNLAGISHTDTSLPLENKVKIKRVAQKIETPSRLTSSHDFRAIIGITILLFGVLLVAMMLPIEMSTGTSTIQIGECRQMILGFEQRGFFTSQEQFKSALSYCYAE